MDILQALVGSAVLSHADTGVGRTAVIKKNCVSENHGKLETALSRYLQSKASLGACVQIADMSKEDFIGYLGANGISIFKFDDEREFVEEMNNA